VPVLITGGGPVGMTAGNNVRTREIFRALGL